MEAKDRVRFPRLRVSLSCGVWDLGIGRLLPLLAVGILSRRQCLVLFGLRGDFWTGGEGGGEVWGG